jgi:hypothetical protein
MKLKFLSGFPNKVIVLLVLLQICFAAFVFSIERKQGIEIDSIIIQADNIQRDKIPFTIVNSTIGEATWEWKIVDSEDGEVIATSQEAQPTFSLPRGCYDVLVTAHGSNQLTRHFRRYFSVLPKVFPSRKADEVIDLSTYTGPTIIKNYGNKKRPGYRIIIKGKFDGRIKITGLRGTKKNPVHIINEGLVEITAANDNAPYAIQWSDDNQYILFDGKADPQVEYGFVIRGHAKKSGQIFFIGGKFNKGFEMCGVNLIGNQGVTYGAAAIQLQTAYSEECNADNWNFEYMRVHNCKIEKSSSEGMYIGYFTDEERDTGYKPFRCGQVLVYRDSIINSGWDAVQIASADEFEMHDNYIDGASLSGKRSHSSFLSWNSGNAKGWCYRNTMKNSAHAASIFFGKSGKEAYIYSNLLIEGTYPSTINSPAFFFSKLYNANEDVGLFIFHNTIITSRIGVKVDYKNTRPDKSIKLLYASNAIIQNKINLKTYPDIALGRNLADSANWTINNIWKLKDNENEMLWSEDYHPQTGSPLLDNKFEIHDYIENLKGGFYDHDGYPLKHSEKGYTFGCFSAYKQSKEHKSEARGIH